MAAANYVVQAVWNLLAIRRSHIKVNTSSAMARLTKILSLRQLRPMLKDYISGICNLCLSFADIVRYESATIFYVITGNVDGWNCHWDELVIIFAFVCSCALKYGWFPSHTLNSRTYWWTNATNLDIYGLLMHVNSLKLMSTKHARSMTFWFLNISLQQTKILLLVALLLVALLQKLALDWLITFRFLEWVHVMDFCWFFMALSLLSCLWYL